MKALKITGIVFLVLVLLLVSIFFYIRYQLNHMPDTGDLEAKIDRNVKRFFEMDASGSALVIGIYKDGRSTIKGYGTTVKGETVLPDANSVFELASTSKLFTTTLLQMLVDKGIVRLDDRISDLLRDQVALPPAAANTTLRHLATHRSGFPGLPDAFLQKMQDTTNPYKDLTTADLYNYLKTCEGKRPEGAFEYSNFGMGLLGHVLALRLGMPYETAVQQELLRPLGMTHTFVTPNSTQVADIVQGYTEAGTPNPMWTDTVLTGAGSFLSNAADMLLFIRANVDQSHPLYPTMARTHALQPGEKTALGWMQPDGFDRFMGNRNILWHNGLSGGYASYLAIDTAAKAGIIVLSNVSKDISADAGLLMRVVKGQSWDKK